MQIDLNTVMQLLPHLKDPAYIAGVLTGPALLYLVPSIVKEMLKVTAMATKKLAVVIPPAFAWAMKFPLFAMIIRAEPKACETLIDTMANCLTALVMTVQTLVDAEIEKAKLEKAPDPVGAPVAPPAGH